MEVLAGPWYLSRAFPDGFGRSAGACFGGGGVGPGRRGEVEGKSFTSGILEEAPLLVFRVGVSTPAIAVAVRPRL